VTRQPIDLTGQRFGRLVAVRIVGRDRYRRVQWACVCDCGRKSIATTEVLRQGKTRSCGCLMAETRVENGHKRTEQLKRYASKYWDDRRPLSAKSGGSSMLDEEWDD
jgi:hypothetical protein